MTKGTKKEEMQPDIPDYTAILNRIFTALIILIVITGLNTVILLVSNGESVKQEETTTTNNEYDVSMFTEVDANTYAANYKKDELIVTYFGRSDCGYCIKFLPVLQAVQKEYKYTTYYVDINKLDQETANIFYELNSTFDDTLGRTPMVTITKNGEIVDYQMGYVDEDTFVSFLKKNNVIK